VGELSIYKDKQLPYPLLEITASGMTHTDLNYTHDKNLDRVQDVYVGLHFGLFTVNWSGPEPKAKVQLMNQTGAVVMDRRIDWEDVSAAERKSNFKWPPEPAID
jgi:hypothetical protein